MALTKKLGHLGEDLAVHFLQTQNYTILARNFRQRFGEVDIVAQKNNVIIFVEVKTRSTKQFGSPFEAVDKRKQKQLSRIAAYYLQKNNLHDVPARFDVLAVTLEHQKDPEIELITNAFDYIE